ncbi:hypothetical protein [Helicobacter sp. MIT 14-3879]|uniref:hypothetical protein n=1 Tax=Helicobacter sp. MIT 14-3879 TaxID=2040649 RepID=UPI000E1F1636|nr:hypothetical protein [Helicobacter sp. MIT 14-3879]RDU64765.1 hypothetical protein CQA44_03375 [Helicobacter sp. MIT 14-3879]
MKKIIFSIIFILLTSALFLFIANEYIKRLEIKAIINYIDALKDELKEYLLNITHSDVACIGFIKHSCNIKNIEIESKKSKIILENVRLSIINLSFKQIGVEASIDKISHNITQNPYFVFIPERLIYHINLKKEDSALGYIMLNRHLYLDFNKFNIDINFDILLRDNLFRNKNIIFLLKEWFNTNTPSFYEYSLDSLNIEVNANNINDFYNKHFNNYNLLLSNIITELSNSFTKNMLNNKGIFKSFMNLSYELLNDKLKNIILNVKRKNNKLIFFNILSDEASTKKIAEIEQVLNSINDTYKITINKK